MEKILQTRITLKYDTLANWEASSLVLKAGEAAVATYTIGEGETAVKAVKVKYGDGTNTFANLPEVTAVSADLSNAIAALRTEFETYVSEHSAAFEAYKAAQALLDAAQDQALADAVAAQALVDQAQDQAFNTYKTEFAATYAADKATQAEKDAAQDKALEDYKAEQAETQEAHEAAQKAIDEAQDLAFETYKTEHAAEVAAKDAAQAEKDAAQDKALADYKIEQAATDKAQDEALAAHEQAYAADKAAQAEKDAAQDAALAKEIEDRAAAVLAEENRAKGVEESLQTQINTIINNPDTEGVINSINEFTQYIADHGEIAEGFRQDIDANADAIEALEKKHDEYQVANDAAVAAVDKKVDDLDASLATIAKTGNVNDLIQTEGDVLVFNCGSSTVNI